MTQAAVIGIDIGKTSFHLVAVDASGAIHRMRELLNCPEESPVPGTHITDQHARLYMGMNGLITVRHRSGRLRNSGLSASTAVESFKSEALLVPSWLIIQQNLSAPS